MKIETAMEIAAQCWCKKATEHIEMDVELVVAFAQTLKKEVDKAEQGTRDLK